MCTGANEAASVPQRNQIPKKARRINSKQVRRKEMGSDLHVTASVDQGLLEPLPPPIS